MLAVVFVRRLPVRICYAASGIDVGPVLCTQLLLVLGLQ